MFKKIIKYKYLFYSVATLTGYIIGAGIFALPFMMQKIGYIPAVFLLIVLGLTMILNCLSLAEIILRTRGNHYLPALTGIYLGKSGKWIQFFANTLIGNYGALLAYLVLGGVFLRDLFKLAFEAHETYFVLVFLLLGMILIWKGFEDLGAMEIVLSLVLIGIIFLISFESLDKIDIHNYAGFNLNKVLPSVGVLLFALDGTGGVFTIRNILKRRERLLKKSILITYGLIFLIFFAFTFSLVGVFDGNIQAEAITSIGSILGRPVEIAAVLFGFLAVFSSFLVIGSILKNTLLYDFKLSKTTSWALVWIVPLVLYLAGFKNFIAIISLVGVVVTSVNTVVISLILRKSRKTGNRRPEFVLKAPFWTQLVVIAIYLVAMVFEVSDFIF